MIEIHCAQGDASWLRARAGKQTASLFWLMREDQRLQRGPQCGDWSGAQRDLAYHLACERINGAPLADETFETFAMRRGHRLEPEARSEHEIQLGIIVERVGFATTDDGLFGCSLDGKIDHDGASEYKCLIGPGAMRMALEKVDHSRYMDQCQGGLWITHRRWIDLCFYCPFLRPIGKQLLVRRVYRDDDYIEGLVRDLMAFRELVESYVVQISNLSLDNWFAQAPSVVQKASTPSAFVPAPVPQSQFEALAQRLERAATRAQSDLILDGAFDLVAPDEYAALHAIAKKRWPEVVS